MFCRTLCACMVGFFFFCRTPLFVASLCYHLVLKGRMNISLRAFFEPFISLLSFWCRLACFSNIETAFVGKTINSKFCDRKLKHHVLLASMEFLFAKTTYSTKKTPSLFACLKSRTLALYKYQIWIYVYLDALVEHSLPENDF